MSRKRRVIFRADGNSQIGLGHVVRSLALASMIREEFECIFAIQDPSKELQEQIKEICKGLITLPSCTPEEERFTYELRAYVSSEEIVVLDGYHFKTEYQQRLKETNCMLVCIDDIHAYTFVADVVINHGTLQPSPYDVSFYTKLLLGPRYALLRPPFLRQPIKNNKADSFFLCFGGSDTYNLTLKFLKIIADAGHKNPLEVVVGSVYAHLSELQDFVQKTDKVKNIRLHQNVAAGKLAEIMATCNIAIVPGSSIALECASLGLQLVCGYYVENQKNILKMLTEKEAAIDVGNMLELEADQLKKVLGPLQKNPRPNLTRERLFGGQNPAENLLSEFRKLHLAMQLSVRRARTSDLDIYHIWANDPETRRNAVNTGAIAYEDHVRWFTNKVNSASSALYYFSLGDVPVGQVRFDLEEDVYTIDYAVSSKHRALGLGRSIMVKAIAQLRQDVVSTPLRLMASVKSSNTASKKVFEGLHFEFSGSKSFNGIEYLCYEKSIY